MMHESDILFALLRTAIWQRQPETELFDGIDARQWQRVYSLAVRQGVLAVAFDGISRLPKELHPSFDIKIQWGYNAEFATEKYRCQYTAALDLGRIFADNGIRMMLLKGIGMSLYYPNPSHRQFGDIDIYLFDKFDEGNEVIRRLGIKVDGSYYRHYEFPFKKFNVENHRYFVETHINRTNGYIEQELEKTLDNVRNNSELENIVLPSADFNALFLARHASWHFARESICLRDLCDWALFLHNEIDDIDIDAYMHRLRESGLEKFVSILTDICRDKLGLDVSLPFSAHYPSLCDRVASDILLFSNPVKDKDLGIIRKFILKLKVRIARKWCYDEIVPDNFYGNTLHSVKNYMLHPKTLLQKKRKLC